MKKLAYTFLTIIFILNFMNCASSKKYSKAEVEEVKKRISNSYQCPKEKISIMGRYQEPRVTIYTVIVCGKKIDYNFTRF